MKYLQNILVAVDFSESSDFVIDNAIRLAEKFNSQITLIHVITDDHLNRKLDHFVEETVQAKFDKITSYITQKGIKLKESIITHGVPFEQIIEATVKNDSNVIIVGTSDITEDSPSKLGTTVEKLMRKNETPIWVIKPEPLKEIKKILCPIDFSEASHRALENAIILARKFGADLTIVHVYTPVNYSSIWYEADNVHENKVLREKQEKEFNAFLDNFDFEDVTHNKYTLEGGVHTEILKYIQQHDIDLLLIGTTGRTGISRILMGSTTAKVTQELPCNFVTTKTKDITNDYLESNLKSMESIIDSAKKSFQDKDYERAIEKYTIALKQHPDNIPILLGIIEVYEAMDDQNKVKYYKGYAQKVVERIWGRKYLDKFNF